MEILGYKPFRHAHRASMLLSLTCVWAALSACAGSRADLPSAAPANAPPTTSPASGEDNNHLCQPDLSAAEAEAEYRRGVAAIERAGEHPTDQDLQAILPPLQRAASSGHLAAQVRYGYYVTGYWLTDEMFWPNDRDTAVAALGALRVAIRRGAKDVEADLLGLGKDPAVLIEEPMSMLPAEWIAAAVKWADAWERCHPEAHD